MVNVFIVFRDILEKIVLDNVVIVVVDFVIRLLEFVNLVVMMDFMENFVKSCVFKIVWFVIKLMVSV